MATRQSARAGDVGVLMELSRALVGLSVRSIGAIDGAVTLPQFRALTVLEGSGPCTAGGLADSVGLHISTITRLCDRLVAMGLITREVREDNRRQVEVATTAAGSALVRQVWEAREVELARALRGLTTEQRAALREVAPALTELVGNDAMAVGSSW